MAAAPKASEPLPGLYAKGSIEKETCWVTSTGEMIDVWVIGKVVPGSKGSATHTRFVAQDITANRLLEAELQEKNRRLVETNVELSQRTASSMNSSTSSRTICSGAVAHPDRLFRFLMKDYGDKLDTDAQEYVRYLVKPRGGCVDDPGMLPSLAPAR